MEDAAKYLKRPKLDGDKTELFRIQYDRTQISFELFLWLEERSKKDLIKKGHSIFKAYPILETILVCKN